MADASLLDTTAASSSANAAAKAAAAAKTTAAGSKAETARTQLAGDLSQFLTLLTTQLKNQDPTEPLDTNQMTQQLATFAGVEQQVNTNANLEKLIASANSSKVQAGLNYIGKAIDATGSSGFLANDAATFSYELPAGVSTTSVSILNAAGQAVYSGTGASSEGKNIVTWDGTGNVGAAAGKKLEDGRYTIALVAKDANGKAITDGVTTYTTGRVSAASYDKDGGLNLEVGTLDIPLDDVKSVRDAS